MYNKKQNQKPMIDEKTIDEFEARQTVAMAKLEAYQKVVASIKQMYDSNEKKLKEAKVAFGGSTEISTPELQQKVLATQAASDAYSNACILVANVAKECKETMMREVREFNKMMEEL